MTKKLGAKNAKKLEAKMTKKLGAKNAKKLEAKMTKKLGAKNAKKLEAKKTKKLGAKNANKLGAKKQLMRVRDKSHWTPILANPSKVSRYPVQRGPRKLEVQAMRKAGARVCARRINGLA